MQGIGCNCDPSAKEEGWRGYAEMRRRPAPRGFVREQKGAGLKQLHEKLIIFLFTCHRSHAQYLQLSVMAHFP